MLKQRSLPPAAWQTIIRTRALQPRGVLSYFEEGAAYRATGGSARGAALAIRSITQQGPPRPCPLGGASFRVRGMGPTLCEMGHM